MYYGNRMPNCWTIIALSVLIEKFQILRLLRYNNDVISFHVDNSKYFKVMYLLPFVVVGPCVDSGARIKTYALVRNKHVTISSFLCLSEHHKAFK